MSQAPADMTPDDANEAIRRHVNQMTGELVKDGKVVTSISKSIVGYGDVKIIMKWAVLGEKQTKKARRAARAEKTGTPGHTSVPTDSETGTVYP
jgi:hypothetical protein